MENVFYSETNYNSSKNLNNFCFTHRHRSVFFACQRFGLSMKIQKQNMSHGICLFFLYLKKIPANNQDHFFFLLLNNLHNFKIAYIKKKKKKKKKNN